MLGDFNADDSESSLSEFLEQCAVKNIIKEKICFKNLNRSTSIDQFLTDSPQFSKYMTIPTGLSDFHKVIITVSKSSFTKLNLLQGL